MKIAKYKQANNPHTPREVLLELSKSKNTKVLIGLVLNPNVPKEILIEFANTYKNLDSKARIREFYTDKYNRIVCAMVSNQNVPLEVLEMLYDEYNPGYFRHINIMSLNENLPIEMLIKLSKHPEYIIRRNVVENPHTPTETLMELTQDKDWIVAIRAKQNRINRIELLS